MAIEKKTILDQIEISVRTGIVSARFVKQLVEDGRVLHEEYHRARVLPGRDVDVEMAAVNLHLSAMGQAEVQDYEHLKDHVLVAHDRDSMKFAREEEQ